MWPYENQSGCWSLQPVIAVNKVKVGWAAVRVYCGFFFSGCALAMWASLCLALGKTSPHTLHLHGIFDQEGMAMVSYYPLGRLSYHTS